MQARIEALESRLNAMQSGSPQNRPESPFEAQPIAEPTLDANVPVNGSTGVKDAGMELGSEPEESPLSILPKKLFTKPTEFIASLIESGERSPSRIAKALNEAGYRTQALSLFERSNPQITRPLKELRG